MSISEDNGFDEPAVDPGDDTRPASPAAKWGMAGLLLAYAGLGSYCVVSALGHGTAGIAASTQPAATSKATTAGQAHAAKAFARAQHATAAPKVAALTAVSATAIGPAGASGDHPRIAPLILDGNSATAWVTHWYASASFGNLKEGTGLVLDMGRMVTIRQVQLALGGTPGFWGADIQIRVGDSPGHWNFAPAAVASDVGGRVAPELRTPVTGRYVQIWFTKLPRDSWGTYQEHVYGVTVRGSVPTARTTSLATHPGGRRPPGGTHPGGGGRPGGGYGGGHGHGGHGR